MEPLGGPDPPGVLVGPSTHDARQQKRDVEEDGAKDGYGPASIKPHHQDDALDVDGVGGELTADASFCWRSNQRGGYACCTDSNCRSNVCITAVCRDCRHNSDCRGSNKYCTGFTEDYVSATAHSLPVIFRVPSHPIFELIFTLFCTPRQKVCKKKGGIGDACDVTGLTDGNGSRPCGDGLSCYYAGGVDHKCYPSGSGSCVETLMEIARDDIGDRYASVTDAISDVIDNSWESAEDLVNALRGDFIFNRIKDIACGTNDLVGRWSQIVHDSCGGETDMKLGATETQGLDGKEEKDSSLVVLVGAEVDSTYLISGLSVSFGVAVEISTEPNVALFVTGCMGPSVGGAAGGFGSVGLQFGGGLGATAGKFVVFCACSRTLSLHWI